MAKKYKVTAGVRAGNRFMGMLLRLGVGPKPIHLLTTVGRKSGLSRTTPVTVVEDNGSRWLVAPYGTVNWVWNARVAGKAILRRGRTVETVGLEEPPRDQAAAILQKYVQSYRIVRPYIDTAPSAPVQEFAAEVPGHPVFRIVPS